MAVRKQTIKSFTKKGLFFDRVHIIRIRLQERYAPIMRRFIGLCSFMISFGMFIGLFIENTFIAIVIISLLMIVGYNLFSC